MGGKPLLNLKFKHVTVVNIFHRFVQDNKSRGSDDAARYDDDAELFAEDFQAGYVKNLLRLQQEVIKLPDSEEHYDIYLARKLYPVLLPGVELLAREIDRLTNKES